MKKILTFIFLTLAFAVYSQESENDNKKQIKKVINQFFEALEKKDSVLLKDVTMAEGQIWRIYSNESPSRANMRFVEDDLKTFEGLPPLKEIALDFEININHDIAVAWVPYEFWLNDKFSHCGIDIFNLFKIDDAWKIISMAYSVQKDNCDELRRGEK